MMTARPWITGRVSPPGPSRRPARPRRGFSPPGPRPSTPPRTAAASGRACPGRRGLLLGVLGLGLLAWLAGCSSTLVTLTKRSGIEQQLLVRSLERAVSRLDIHRLAGKQVALELFALTEDQAFAKQLVTARLEERGVDVVTDAGKADLRLEIFASVLGVDRGQTLVGIPGFTAPLVGLPFPEIALFKWVRNRGRSEVQVFAYDGRTDRFLEAIPAEVGRAKYDEYTLLLAIGFTSSDLDEPPGPPGE